MTRKNIIAFIFVLFVAAFIFVSFAHRQDILRPYDKGPITIVYLAAGAFGLVAASGILPLIVWAFFRFRAEKALYPLLAWAAIGITSAFGQAMWSNRPDNSVDRQIDDMVRGQSTNENSRDNLKRAYIVQRQNAIGR